MNIESGWYYFRTTSIDKNGETVVLHSPTYHFNDNEDLKKYKSEWLERLAENGHKNITITHTTKSDNPFSHYPYGWIP